MTGARHGAAVLGSPISHSLSPVLHRSAYAELGLDDWTYRAVECDEPVLAEQLRALDDDGLAGVSLTMPLKRAVMPLLTRRQRLAADLGVANTVVFGGQRGEWWGANTDVAGMVAVLEAAGVRLRGARPWLLGAGATATSAIAALAELGAREAVVVARRVEAAGALVDRAARLGVFVDLRPWFGTDDSAADPVACAAAPLVVATTPAGATDPLAAGIVRADGLLLDVVYDPWPTVLATAWAAAGGQAIGGLELLVEQAAEQVTLMTGLAAPVEVMRAAGRRALAERAIG